MDNFQALFNHMVFLHTTTVASLRQNIKEDNQVITKKNTPLVSLSQLGKRDFPSFTAAIHPCVHHKSCLMIHLKKDIFI